MEAILLLSFIFTQGRSFWETFSRFKRQSNSVGVQYIVSLFKMFSYIQFNSLLGMKPKRADVKSQSLKVENVLQFWLHHVMWSR